MIQGFFNAMIFIRPKYFRWRRRHPEDSRLQCLVAALSGATPKVGRNTFTSYVSTPATTAPKKEAPVESDVALNDNDPKPNLAAEGKHDDFHDDVEVFGLNDNAPPRIRHISFQSECSDDDIIDKGSHRLSLKATARRLQLEMEDVP